MASPWRPLQTLQAQEDATDPSCEAVSVFPGQVLARYMTACLPEEAFLWSRVSPEWMRRWQQPDVWTPFRIDFEGRDIGNRGAQGAASRVPRQTKTVDACFRTSGVCEEGARAFAERVPPGLTHLYLDFGFCKIGEEGARAVAESLPPGLTHLYLGFPCCGIGDAGARAVAEHLPPGLTCLDLDFCACSIRDAARAVAERLPPGLTQLYLGFGDPIIDALSNKAHWDAGARAVAERLPLGLTCLELNFGGCWIGDAVASRGLRIPSVVPSSPCTYVS